MKKCFIVLLAVVLATVTFSTIVKADNTIQFKDTKLGDITVGSFDWTPGNALGYQGIPIAGTKPFTLFYQASLASFNDPVTGLPIIGTGLGTDYEITAIAASGEIGTLIGGTVLLLAFDNTNSTNYVKIYYDTAKNANPLLGTGFDDGTLLMEGEATASSGNFLVTNLDQNGIPIPVQFDQFPSLASNNYPGVGTVVGNGSSVATVDIDPTTINSTYITPSGTSVLSFTLNFNTSQILPFNQQNPSKAFWDDLNSVWITPVYGPGTGAYPNGVNGVNACPPGVQNCDIQFQADANNSFLYTRSECCVDIEKEVSVNPFPNPEWKDADTCSDSDVPLVIAPHNAMYRLIVKNCGQDTLTNVVINDPTLGITNYSVGNLAPQGQIGDQQILTGQDIPQLGFNANQCTSSGSFLNTSNVSADCSDPAQSPVTDQDSACWKCQEQVGGCRMTGGHNTVAPDGSVYVVPGDSEVTSVAQSGKKTTTFKYTVGGQIGAPQAGCCTPGVDCAPGNGGYGEWEHSHRENGVLKFSFHAGTNSAPPDSYIQCITCSDPFWCVQARCAPFKQIFWEGTGVFQNPNKNNDAHFSLGSCNIDPVAGKTHSLHYYQAHVGDFGEPGNTGKQKSYDPAVCSWHSGGVDVENTVLMQPQPPQADPKFPQFFDKGGMLCQDCPDYYEIEVHCTDNPSSPIIYRAAGYLTGGNHQLHPEVGQQCPYGK